MLKKLDFLKIYYLWYMTLTSQIQSKILKLPEGKSFGYADLGIAKNDFQAAAKAIERL